MSFFVPTYMGSPLGLGFALLLTILSTPQEVLKERYGHPYRDQHDSDFPYPIA